MPLPPTPAWRIGSGHLFGPRSMHMFHGLVIIPCCSTAHTGYQTGKHSGNRSHSLSRQQGEEQHDLTLPAQNETGKRLLGSGGRGKQGWDRRRDDEAPMWGTGRTLASLHVHTTSLGYIARWSKSPGGVLVAGPFTTSDVLVRELRELPTHHAGFLARAGLGGNACGSSNLQLMPDPLPSNSKASLLLTWSVNK